MSAAGSVTDFAPFATEYSGTEPFFWSGYDVSILQCPALIEREWRELEVSGICSAFQSFDYLSDWIRTASAVRGETPHFVVGRRGQKTHFILPLATRSVGCVRVLGWLAQSHANYGMGIFSRDCLAETARADFKRLITDLARSVGAHVVHLDAQPARWMSFDNPFAASQSSLLSGNDTYVVRLDDDFGAQYRRLFSSASLAKLRRKWRRISECGCADFKQPTSRLERHDALMWFAKTKGAQLKEAGRSNPFGPAHIRAFYSALSERPGFLIDELTLDGKPETVGLTMRHGYAAYYLNTAYHHSEMSKYSPGVHLFHQLVKRLHADGVRVVDLGPGDVPYKHEWEPEVINLRTATHLISPLALPHYLVLRASVMLRCALKRNPVLIKLAHRAIAFSRGRKT